MTIIVFKNKIPRTRILKYHFLILQKKSYK